MARQGTVLVIFSHDLLGQGLAARLQSLGVQVLAVRSSDAGGATQALGELPDAWSSRPPTRRGWPRSGG